MSMKSAAAFFDKAIANKTVQDQVMAATAEKDPEAKGAAVAALGKSMGFDFTPDEAIRIRAATRKTMIDGGELNDELDDLDLQVATGGVSQSPYGAGSLSMSDAILLGKSAAERGTQNAVNGGGTTGFAQAVGNPGQTMVDAVNKLFSGW
jgi:hypothetical protein